MFLLSKQIDLFSFKIILCLSVISSLFKHKFTISSLLCLQLQFGHLTTSFELSMNFFETFKKKTHLL